MQGAVGEWGRKERAGRNVRVREGGGEGNVRGRGGGEEGGTGRWWCGGGDSEIK